MKMETKQLAEIYVKRLIDVGAPQMTPCGESFLFSDETQDEIMERTQRQVKTVLKLQIDNERPD